MFYTDQNQMNQPNSTMGCELGEYCRAEGLDQLYVLSEMSKRNKKQKQKRAWETRISTFRKRIEYAFSK